MQDLLYKGNRKLNIVAISLSDMLDTLSLSVADNVSQNKRKMGTLTRVSLRQEFPPDPLDKDLTKCIDML